MLEVVNSSDTIALLAASEIFGRPRRLEPSDARTNGKPKESCEELIGAILRVLFRQRPPYVLSPQIRRPLVRRHDFVSIYRLLFNYSWWSRQSKFLVKMVFYGCTDREACEPK